MSCSLANRFQSQGQLQLVIHMSFVDSGWLACNWPIFALKANGSSWLSFVIVHTSSFCGPTVPTHIR